MFSLELPPPPALKKHIYESAEFYGFGREVFPDLAGNHYETWQQCDCNENDCDEKQPGVVLWLICFLVMFNVKVLGY